MQLKDLESLSKWMLTYPSIVKPPLTWRIIHVRADTAIWLLSECPDCSVRRCCGCILTLSWLISARKRLCFLYRSSFRGSCQYCACTRLITTKAASNQTIKKTKQKRTICSVTDKQFRGTKGKNLLLLNPIGVSSSVQSFTYYVADVGALSRTPGQPIHSWVRRNTHHKPTSSEWWGWRLRWLTS